MKKNVNIDIDGDGVKDIQLDLKTIIMVVGGIISLTLTYSALKSEIEIAKKLPVQQEINLEIVEQKIKVLENTDIRIEKQLDTRIDALEKKVFRR
jgi:plasmid maintenance system antidote protein VapI